MGRIKHGYATCVVAREHEDGRHGHEVLERHNEESVLGIAATVLRREAWDGYEGGRFERRKTSSATLAAYATMHNTRVDPSTADHSWWTFLHVNLVMVLVAVFHLCVF